ncbi:MAG: phospho-sugar mutase [Acholeplasmataceae bacterium]|nr:phospho-sugar mutase [Acholeplasmataceae bacterium]
MEHLKRYNEWKAYESLDEALKKELNELSDDDIKEAFYRDLEFGTGGLRGLMGVGTNRINLYTIRRATLGFANYLLGEKIDGGVAISYDNRKDSRVFAIESAKVLAYCGIKSYVYRNLRPTPMLSYAVRHFDCAGGIMITASHNPKEYNGYKAYDKTGAQLNPHDANRVVEEILKIENIFDVKTLENDLIHYIEDDFDWIYLEDVKKIAVNSEELRSVKIAYSPLHGTGGPIIPKFLTNMGYDLNIYIPQLMVDPTFSKTRSSNPEEALAFEYSIEYAKEIKADIVMVTDPDADRLGIAVKHNNEFMLLTGNQTAAIELFYLLDEKKKRDLLPKKGFVYTTNVTTDLIPRIAKSYGMDVVTTLTGFKFIGEQAEKNKDVGAYMFGCEESYGSLVLDFVRDKDAVQAVYLLAEISNVMKNRGMTLIDYLEHIYKIYGYYVEYTQSITLKGISGVEKIDKIMEYYRANPPVLHQKKLLYMDDVLKGIHVEDEEETKLDYPTSNVLKYVYENDTWIVFRPSGTEPKIKIYYGTKHKSIADAKAFIDGINQKIKQDIERIE